MHLRAPSVDRGVSSFIWAFVLALYLWLGMLAIGIAGGTAFIVSAVAFGLFFLFIRRAGGDELRPTPQATRSS